MFPIEQTKRCSTCKEIKPLGEFHKRRAARDGLQRNCKQCNVERAKQFHAENAEHCRGRIKKLGVKKREVLRALLLEYLETHPCVDCGETDPVVLEFDHLRDKIANVSAMVNNVRRWEVILAEIAKCDVVCANCHRRRTVARVGGYRYRLRQKLAEEQ